MSIAEDLSNQIIESNYERAKYLVNLLEEKGVISEVIEVVNLLNNPIDSYYKRMGYEC